MISKSLPCSFKGGIQTHVWELSEHLIDAGVQVSILTGGSFLKKTSRTRIEGREIITIPFIPWRRFPWFRASLEELAFNIAAARWVAKHHKNYDIIHLQGRSGYFVPFMKIETPIVNTVHRLWSVEGQWSDRDFKNKFEASVFRKLTCFIEERAIKNSAAVIAVSQSTIDEILEKVSIDPQKVKLVYNGAADRDGKVENERIKKQLLFVGRLCAIKGIFPLIEAMAQLNNSQKLIMVGDGPAQAELKIKIAQKGLTEQIELVGSQNQQVVRKLMRQSYALILPSYHESQGIVLMENNIEGRPVLASATAGIKEVVFHQHNGLLFPSNSVQGIVNAIQELFSDPEAAAAMGQRGREMVKKHFSWEKIAQQTIQIYSQL